MLNPILLTMDVFWTKDGVKILELQHGRRSGTKGYRDLFNKNPWETIFNPFLEGLEKDGWIWEKCPRKFDNEIGKKPEDMLHHVDGNFTLNAIFTNKALQSALLPSLKPLFPDEHIFAYDQDWDRLWPKIQNRFKGKDEIVAKASEEAVGRGIIPIKTKNLIALDTLVDWVNDDVFWHRNMFAPAFTVQERVQSIALEHKSETYEAPIRLWMALVPHEGRLEPYFFNNGDHPTPIYYKLPKPLGSGDFAGQVLSDVHQGESVAPVPIDIQNKIFEQLSLHVPNALQTAMETSYDELISNALESDDEGSVMLMLHHLIFSEQVFSVLDGENQDFLEKIRPQFKSHIKNHQAFRDYFGIMLALDPYHQKFIMESDESLIFDVPSQTYEKTVQSELQQQMTQAGFLFDPRQLPSNIFKKTRDRITSRIKPCALI